MLYFGQIPKLGAEAGLAGLEAEANAEAEALNRDFGEAEAKQKPKT